MIATEGATAQMVDANAYGMNWKGLYDPELIEFYGRQWRERAARLSETVKLVVLSGRYTDRPRATVGTTRWPATSPTSSPPPTTRRSPTTTCW